MAQESIKTSSQSPFAVPKQTTEGPAVFREKTPWAWLLCVVAASFGPMFVAFTLVYLDVLDRLDPEVLYGAVLPMSLALTTVVVVVRRKFTGRT